MKCGQCCSQSTYFFFLNLLINLVLEWISLGALNQGGQAQGMGVVLEFSVCVGDVVLTYRLYIGRVVIYGNPETVRSWLG